MLRLYIIGICILTVAIVANYIIGKLGLTSWYDFLNYLNDKESSGLKQIRLIDYLWLLLGYPLILGFGYLIGQKIYTLIFS